MDKAHQESREQMNKLSDWINKSSGQSRGNSEGAS